MSSCLNAQLVAALAPSVTGLWEVIERPRTPRLDNIQSSEIWDVEPASRHYRDYLTLKCKSTWPANNQYHCATFRDCASPHSYSDDGGGSTTVTVYSSFQHIAMRSSKTMVNGTHQASM